MKKHNTNTTKGFCEERLRKMGHLRYKNLKKKPAVCTGLPQNENLLKAKNVCKVCIHAKQIRLSIKFTTTVIYR